METKADYFKRFTNSKPMIELFPTVGQRFGMARQVFNTQWKEALVTVTRADGTMFFIE